MLSLSIFEISKTFFSWEKKSLSAGLSLNSQDSDLRRHSCQPRPCQRHGDPSRALPENSQTLLHHSPQCYRGLMSPTVSAWWVGQLHREGHSLQAHVASVLTSRAWLSAHVSVLVSEGLTLSPPDSQLSQEAAQRTPVPPSSSGAWQFRTLCALECGPSWTHFPASPPVSKPGLFHGIQVLFHEMMTDLFCSFSLVALQQCCVTAHLQPASRDRPQEQESNAERQRHNGVPQG